MEENNYVYILKCSDNTLYTGWTNDIKKREKVHNAGKGAKYTRARLPVEVVYLQKCVDKSSAMSREWHIKQLSRTAKNELLLTKDNIVNTIV